jgi:integrase/recombinase XerD
MISLEEYLQENYTKSTKERYLRDIKVYLNTVKRPKTAKYKDILKYIGYLRQDNKSPENIYVIIQSIKKYYNWLNHSGQREDHPCKDLKLRDRKHREINLQDLFSTKELELLMNRNERYSKLKTRNKVIISLLIYQGLTTGELTNLSIKDIDLLKGTIYIKPTNRTNSRTIALKPTQIMLFYEYLTETRQKLLTTETDKLIINQRGKPETGEGINYLTSTFKKLFPNRNLNPITIRQSVIANLLKQGKELRAVQAFAGHKYPSTTEQYRQTGLEELRSAMEKYHPLNKL